MKATGIVRRIDDLGRIVIPKEIRRTLHIRETDPMEIFTDRGYKHICRKICGITVRCNRNDRMYNRQGTGYCCIR